MRSFLKLFALLSFVIGNAQNIQIDDTYTAQQLVQNVLVNSTCASVSNFSVSGGNFGDSSNSYAFFTNTSPDFPFASGVVLTTGKAISAQGPGSNLSDDGNNLPWGGDADLNQALGVSNTLNTTILEFDFIPQTSNISFDYIFASEEYHGSAQCTYSDGFAFLLKKVGSSTYQNLAIVPGTNIPVKVTSVHPDVPGACSAQNEVYFGSYNPSNYPTTFEGQTVVMTAKGNVTPGDLYHIKLVIADEGNFRYDSAIFLKANSFESSIDLGIDHLVATNNPYCAGDNITLDATQPGTNTYKWFKDGINTGVTTPTFPITDNTNGNVVSYEVEVLINGTCLSTGEVKVQFASLPSLSNQVLVQCDDNNDGSAIFNLTKLDNLIKNGDTSLGNVSYYETIGSTAINNTTSYSSIPKIIYAEVANAYGCKSFCQVSLQIANNPVNSPKTYQKCDEDGTKDGKTTFDLNTEVTPVVLNGLPSGLTVQYYSSKADAATENSALQNNFTNSIANNQTIYARVINGPDCYGLVEVNLEVNYLNPSNFGTETFGICQGNPLTLSVPNIYSSYSWLNLVSNTNEATISTAGNYSVEVTDTNGCKATKKFIVESSAPATNIDAQIVEFTGNENNSILITYTDNGGNYVFSIDGINYQSDPHFYGVDAGEYTISVKDLNGCLQTPTKIIYVLDYPSFFTPNGDGYNDTWVIKNIKTKPNTLVSIFDRFGKLLKQFSSNSEGWNGTFNSQNLPATDYWFTLTLPNENIVKGHFALKR